MQQSQKCPNMALPPRSVCLCHRQIDLWFLLEGWWWTFRKDKIAEKERSNHIPSCHLSSIHPAAARPSAGAGVVVVDDEDVVELSMAWCCCDWGGKVVDQPVSDDLVSVSASPFASLPFLWGPDSILSTVTIGIATSSPVRRLLMPFIALTEVVFGAEPVIVLDFGTESGRAWGWVSSLGNNCPCCCITTCGRHFMKIFDVNGRASSTIYS